MNSYIYRDARRQKLNEALAALTDEQTILRLALEAEQAALQTDDWTVTDRTVLAVAELWLWSIRPPASLKALVDDDPVLTAQGTIATLTDAQAAAIQSLFFPLFTSPPFNYLEQVRAAVGQDEAIFTELLQAAHHRWVVQPEAERLYPFDDVGVLLPLRLETLFDAPGSAHNDDPTRWRLSLRVIPDEASICRDNAFVSEGESRALVAFWQAVKQPGELNEGWLDGDAAEIAWKQLCDRVTPARAAWLVATIPPRLEGETVLLELPADMPDAAQPNRVGGMPPELRVFAITSVPVDGDTRHAIGRLPMEEGTQIDPEALVLPLPSRLEEEKDRWWASWEKAKTVGLGGEWLLPEGMNPQTIRALFVVGIGDETPEAHLKAQVDAGELAVLQLGTPTNAVRGEAAASLGTDAAEWRQVARVRLLQRLDPEHNPVSNAGSTLQLHLTGNSNALPFFPGANVFDDTAESKRMADALWPALWGHWLRDLWQAGDDAFRVGLWTSFFFYPEGPLMPVRIGDQPYGLLPVTALSQWEVDSTEADQRQVQKAMAAALNELRGRWASAVQEKRSVVGKSSRQFIELLAQGPLSKRFMIREFFEAWAGGVPFQLSQEFDEAAFRMYESAIQVLGLEPAGRYLTGGFPWNCDLPLVQPTRMLYTHQHSEERIRLPLSAFLELLLDENNFAFDEDPQGYDLEAIFRRNWVLGERDCELSTLPDSLLIRLLVYACQTAFRWRAATGGSEPAGNVLDEQRRAALALAEMIDDAAWHGEERDPFSDWPIFTVSIPDEQRTRMERALRATLDSAAHRIDPWITGFAWQRLQRHSGSPRHAHRLGAYGWVDGPFIGRPGPTDSGRLHTPSYSQALAALILRDKFLSSTRAGAANENGDNPWERNITSSKARLAEEIADEVRMGFHIYEIVGRHVENIIGTHQGVKELRTTDRYAMRPQRKDPNEVCNGMRAVVGLLKGGDPEAKVTKEDLKPDAPPNDDPAFPLTDEQRRRLKTLHLALDVYGDLLMADGVLQLVNRQVDRAAETMEAAAGFSRPPSFEFIRTPPSGYQLESVVVSTLPFLSVEGLADDASPGRLADPSVAAFIESKLGDGWTWQAVNVDDGAVLGAVTLAELALSPIDTLSLSDDLLIELARTRLGLPRVTIGEGRNRAWQARDAQGNPLGEATLVELNLPPEKLAALDDLSLHSHVRATLGVAEDAVIAEIDPADPRLWIVRDENGALLGMAALGTLGLAPAEVDALDLAELYRRVRQQVGVPQARIDAPREHQLAQQLVASLGSRPAAGRDFTDDTAAQAGTDAGIYGELHNRYEKLYAACQQMIQDLRDAPDDAARAAALRRALAWGVTPVSEPADRKALLAALSGTELPEGATPLAALAEAVAKTLEDRLAAAPEPGDLATVEQIGAPLPDQEARKLKHLPEGVPTLARAIVDLASPSARLAILACWSQDALVDNTNLATAQIEPGLDEAWLTVVAATRANLARLEALQLEMEPPLDAWSSSPGDPWRTGGENVVKQNLKRRSEASSLKMEMPRFVAAYGTAEAWAGDKVAVGLIDAFGEAIPMPQRSTMTAFGFNAPAARAPQAILLAVPPKPRQHLDGDLLLQIVQETRELAHARTARIEDLGELQALAPSMWLQSSGPVRVRLEPWPLFE